MLGRLSLVVALALAAFPAEVRRTHADPDNLVVHEWGTFTSIAGEDGQAVDWLPLEGQNDLPCFVERFRHFRAKSSIQGTVRMETPVLYFYSTREASVDVAVRFPHGVVTEWFPRAAVTPAETVSDASLLRPGFASSATWSRVKITPGVPEAFPTDASGSHYYAARRTDAAPVTVGNQREKFLFYRGVGRVQLPLSATVTAAGRVQLKSTSTEPLGTVMLFEKRGPRLTYQVQRTSDRQIHFDGPALTGGLGEAARELEQMLVAHGLYPREAEAMVETWRDSWFEEGTRLLYLVPRSRVDAMLPLEITPRPTAIERVFVGRLEVITPETRAEVRRALETADRPVLQKYGRFLLPITQRILAEPAGGLAYGPTLQLAYGALATGRTAVASCQ
jgi:hypothetical protein